MAELRKSRKDIKQLYLTGTNLTLQKTSVLCVETYPEMEIRTGVRISISIPFFFQAIVIDKDGKICSNRSYKKGYVMIDGGIISNFPIHIFDYQKYLDNTNDSTSVVNFETLGIRLDEESQIEFDQQNLGLYPYDIKTVKDFIAAFYNIVHENLNRQSLTKEDWARSIAISTGDIGPRIRRMSEKEKKLLVDNGRKGVQLFLNNQPTD